MLNKSGYDERLLEIKNKIKELEDEKDYIEKIRCRDNKQYIGRCFEMEDYSYILVTGINVDGNSSGVRVECFEYFSEVYSMATFDVEKVVKEVSPSELRKILNNNSRLNEVIRFIEDSK